MPSSYEIPLQPSKPQKLSVQLSGTVYQLALQWRSVAGCWIMDISDGYGNLLIAGVPLVTGFDLMAQHPDLGFPGQLWVQSDGNPNALPTFDNLGVGSHLYFVTTP